MSSHQLKPMSEYIEFETEMSDDGTQMIIYSNLMLTDTADTVEEYTSLAEMEEGTPVAQSLSVIEGIVHLRIEQERLVVTRDPVTDWYLIVEDISAALKDFFL